MAHHVLITGASTGIGRSIAERLVRADFTVVGTVRRPADADRLREEVGCTALLLDVTAPDAGERAVSAIAENVAEGDRVSLVNNAGIAIAGPMEIVPIDLMQQQLAVNVLGPFRLTKAFLPLLRRTRGRVVMMSSISGRIAMPYLGAYAASKFALEAITDSLRREVAAFDVAVVSVLPGGVRTPILNKSMEAAKESHLDLYDPMTAPYREGIQELEKVAMRNRAEGIAPYAVADAVVEALATPRPRTRYIVGRSAQRTAFLTRLVPDRLVDWIIVRRLRK